MAPCVPRPLWPPRSAQAALLCAAALAVCAFYYLGSERHSFSSNSRRIKLGRAGGGRPTDRGPVRQGAGAQEPGVVVSLRPGVGSLQPGVGVSLGPGAQQLHVLMMLTKADTNPALRARLAVAVRSMVERAELRDGEQLHLHLVTDPASRRLGEPLVREQLRAAAFHCQLTFHDVDTMTHELFPVVEPMQQLFSAGAGSYYSDSIFFLSVAMHRIMPAELTHIVQLDLDVKYMSNIRELFEEFDKFQPGAVLGIAREMQPVYRHTFWQYRQENPHTKVGDPPPDGLPGFNSGVLLLNLQAMRQSALYNQLLDAEKVRKLADKYHFKGHLGDQDFFTLIGMEHMELFHVLHCSYNRQLCTWWRDHGYSDIFHLYFKCDGKVKIYHGNCNTPIPDE